jgi:signal peptidase
VATSFAAGGGLLVSAAYRWPLLGLDWFSPILPDVDWAVRALLGTVAPLIALAVARTIYEGTTEFAARYPELLEEESEHTESRSWSSWVVTAVAAILVVVFIRGAFGVEPYLLSGISMEPAFSRGDVVIVRSVPAETLEVNDVIKFRQHGLEFVHRIVEIGADEDGLLFVTKGDNVDRPDEPVPADQIEGKVVFVLPKVGMPSLWIKERAAADDG